MNKVSLSVDYSVVQQCESKVDACFRRLRLSRSKFKKNQSDAKESYLRRILDVHRKEEAKERALAYNKRLKPGTKDPKLTNLSSNEELPTAAIEEKLTEEGKESSESSPRAEGTQQGNDSDSDFDSSPYHRYEGPSTGRRRSKPARSIEREDTETVLEVDEDLVKDYKEGKITKGQYHKVMLFRKKLIHCVCLEDLDRERGGREWQAVETERREMQARLDKEIQRHPKAYSSLHPRRKVTTSHVESIAFRPHPALTSRPSPTAPPFLLSRSPSPPPRPVPPPHSKRATFHNRPVTASGSLGAGRYLLQANPKHGGRLSAQNLSNYLFNRISPAFHKASKTPQPTTVLTAMRRAAARVTEERARSVPYSETLRLRGLSAVARTGRSHRNSGERMEVGLEIPSRLETQRSSYEGVESQGLISY